MGSDVNARYASAATVHYRGRELVRFIWPVATATQCLGQSKAPVDGYESIDGATSDFANRLLRAALLQRSDLWNELGKSLMNTFHGSATNLIATANKSAPKLADLVMNHFPGFRDVCTIDGEDIFFLKRAQIFVGDVNAALKLDLSEISQLTCFADYRVPQLLREMNILEYSPELACVVDKKVEIPANSYDEISIRAATVTAVEDIVDFLNKDLKDGDNRFAAVAVDWYLWQVGEKMEQDGALKPFHRVRTHYY